MYPETSVYAIAAQPPMVAPLTSLRLAALLVIPHNPITGCVTRGIGWADDETGASTSPPALFPCRTSTPPPDRFTTITRLARRAHWRRTPCTTQVYCAGVAGTRIGPAMAWPAAPSFSNQPCLTTPPGPYSHARHYLLICWQANAQAPG
jgi:hypothetical protein